MITAIHKDLLRIGWLVNPLAGIGGAVANKGSDDYAIQQRAHRGELILHAPLRAGQFLAQLTQNISCDNLPQFITTGGVMGAQYLSEYNIQHTLTDFYPASQTSAQDTLAALDHLITAGIDLLVFVGGDGTARDICSVVKQSLPVLGVPSGVKMHSGVFGVTPQAAAMVVIGLLKGELTALRSEEVRDIDEQKLREGRVNSKHFGEMLIPAENRFIQHVKQGGVEVEELVLLDIAAEIRERIEAHEGFPLCLIFAPGSTTQFIQKELGFSESLLGVDVVMVDENIKVLDTFCDVNGQILLDVVNKFQFVKLIITAIGGQGHIIGRGNQQLLPSVLAKIGKSNTWVVATKTKLEALQRRPLIFDSSDPKLDADWQGFMPVICGYRDQLLYPLGLTTNCRDMVKTVLAELTRKKDVFFHQDSRRLLHGRGGCFPGLEWCSVDYFAPVVFITAFQEPPVGFTEQLLMMLAELFSEWQIVFPTVLLQRRFCKPVTYELLSGDLPKDWIASWNNLSFELNNQYQNVGFFLDAEPLRRWLVENCLQARVLNLFAYTCAFSVVASHAGAQSVVNIDMNRQALETGRRNHISNSISTKSVRFLPHNIFKSWGKLKQLGPYDVVIIDPPSFQKGSFVAVNDYSKVLRRMDSLVTAGGRFVACHNAPELTFSEFKLLIEECCPEFVFEKRLEPSPDFPDTQIERALKMCIYRRRKPHK